MYSGNIIADMYDEMRERRIEAFDNHHEERNGICECCGEEVSAIQLERNCGICDGCVMTGRAE